MKRILFTLFLGTVFGLALNAQPTAELVKTSTAPEIDGVIDAIWAITDSNSIEQPYREETPSVGDPGTTYWKGLWNADGIFILLVVNDDVFFPAYEGADPGSNWLYDKPEIYFDVNADLADGGGPSDNPGHYQTAPGFEADKLDGTPTTTDAGVIYSYKVSNPAYVAEYFFPFSYLKDSDGNDVLPAAEMGFDITVIDRDAEDQTPDHSRSVWANIGEVDESWTNMDDCGRITLKGAGDATLAKSITLSSAGDASTIETEAGTLQMTATLTPADVTYTTVSWKVENGTGKASISNTGLLSAQLNGTVTVVATTKDGTNLSATKEITISHQFVTISDINVIKNGDFNVDGAAPEFWGFWTGNKADAPGVSDGVAVCAPILAVDTGWYYQFNQSNLNALPDIPYIFSFVAWSDAERTINVDFEDISGNNYNRYGSSSDVESTGRSDWTFTITTDPTRYIFHVIFDQIVENTVQKVQFMLAQSNDYVYLDSIYLVSEDDLSLLSTPGVGVPKTGVKSLQVYPNPAVSELVVSLSAPNAKVTIYNSVGRKVDEVYVTGSQARFDVRNYAKGVYFVRVNDSIVKFVR
jgi:hypothetical protein